MISSDCLSENENGSHAAGDCWRKFTTPGADGCSPIFELSANSSTSELSSSRNNLTPRRKLSLCSASSSPGALTASDKRHHTPDSHGIKFRALNLSAEESSPYLQYRAGHCMTKDRDSQKKNESSPAKRTRSKRSREHPSLNRLVDERVGAVDECFSGLRQIHGCSPLLPSPPAEEAHLDAIPQTALHFDRQLVRTALTTPASQDLSGNLPEELTSFPFPNEAHFALSSTPVHSQTSRTITPFSIPFRLSDASPGVVGSMGVQCLFTPVKNPPFGSEFSRDDPAFEHARRNLFHAYVPKVSGKKMNSPTSGSPPSSGYVSNPSTGSLLASLGSSSGSAPLSVMEKMDFEEGEETCDGIKTYVGEDIPVGSLKLASGFAVNHENGEPSDVDDLVEEESGLRGLCSGGEQASLIGDFSRLYALPLVPSRNRDLKAISPDTMADILAGCYDDVVDCYAIVDCRYPYEFSGGHIRGAKNIYEEEALIREFFQESALQSHLEPTKRSILIFHCEFSSERAPKLLRFLRKNDRDINTYPFLCYPEAYILEGGYKAFFESHPRLCDPSSYVPMLQTDYSNDLKKFRAKSRSYQDECGKRLLKKLCASANY